MSYFREDQWAAATIWGCPRTEAESKAGFRELGIEQCPPILTRGVLLDMPRSKGLEVLPDKYGITRDDIEACCQTEAVEIRPGDCALIRTGFFEYRDQQALQNSELLDCIFVEFNSQSGFVGNVDITVLGDEVLAGEVIAQSGFFFSHVLHDEGIGNGS